MNTKKQVTNPNPLTIAEFYEAGLADGSLLKTQKKLLFAARLREELRSRKIKPINFAKSLGKSPSEISRWLSGNHNFTLETITEIEIELGISLIDTNIKYSPNLKTITSEPIEFNETYGCIGKILFSQSEHFSQHSDIFSFKSK